ncbi:BID domain-containing T4SS effector [Bartonella doshiae]|uniref:BID domain-containing T4SS effector n=1 Tax=Bartonella doshiae TaxID=33044 RepID=UPI001ABA8F29|nr:BID domain-containing T4SS effector [Bartonella doshiae]
MKKNQTGHSAPLTREELEESKKVDDAELRQKLKLASQSFAYPNSNVLKNKYGIKEQDILNKQCSHDVTQEMIKLYQEPLPEKFDSAYLKYIHKRLFQHTFEWAGETRDKSFTFKDGSVAFTPIIKRKEFKTPFATSKQVAEGLQNLDETLASKNYLKGLSREAFVDQTAALMIELHRLHPFREGNKRTQRMFVEKLALAAGHNLDFSLVTKKRKQFVSVEAMDNNNPEPMRHLLDDISHPDKLLALNEFTNAMRDLDISERNYRLAVVAKDGETYHGVYRGGGENGFMMDVNGTFIIGVKSHLPPEQVKALKIGDRFSFKAPKAQDMQETLIAREKLAPLTNDELAERVKNSTLVQESMKKIDVLCKVVYGDSRALYKKMPKIEIPTTVENLTEGERFARHVGAFPDSIKRIRGINVCGLKSGARQHAEENFLPLSHAIHGYVHAYRLAEKEILEKHQIEQQRCDKWVGSPSEEMRNLLSLPKQEQQELLTQSPELRAEIKVYMGVLSERLSPMEQKAIENRNHYQLAESLGTSLNKAKEIAGIFQQGKEIQRDMQQSIQKSMQPAHVQHRNSKDHATVNRDQPSEGYTKNLDKSAIQAEKVTESVIQERAVQQSIRQRKSESVKVVSMCL